MLSARPCPAGHLLRCAQLVSTKQDSSALCAVLTVANRRNSEQAGL